jgi:hypothetical protein
VVPNAHFNFLSMPAAVRRRWRDPLKYSCPPFYRKKQEERGGAGEEEGSEEREQEGEQESDLFVFFDAILGH